MKQPVKTIRNNHGLSLVIPHNQSLDVCRTTSGEVNIYCTDPSGTVTHFFLSPADACYFARAILESAGPGEAEHD